MKVDITRVEYIFGFLGVVWDVLVQKLKAYGLGSVSKACHPDVRNKTCIVTGATSGIGLETARELARKGARVVLAVRNTEAAEQVLATWREDQPDITAEVMHLDLSSLASIRDFCRQWDKEKPIHVLINNAGVFAMAGKQKITVDGLEEHFAVNFLGQALLILLLLPALKSAGSARVVNVSSQMHELGELDFSDLHFTKGRKFSPIAAYCQSKLAQVFFTNALHRRLPEFFSIDIIALHPGEVVTNVGRTLPAYLRWGYRYIMPFACLMPREGARAPLFCATNPSVSEYAAMVRRTCSPEGPYYSSSCKPVNVARHARNKEVADYTLAYTVNLLGFSKNYLDEVCSAQ